MAVVASALSHTAMPRDRRVNTGEPSSLLPSLLLQEDAIVGNDNSELLLLTYYSYSTTSAVVNNTHVVQSVRTVIGFNSLLFSFSEIASFAW